MKMLHIIGGSLALAIPCFAGNVGLASNPSTCAETNCQPAAANGADGASAPPAISGVDGVRIAARCKVSSQDRMQGFLRTKFTMDGCEAWVVEPDAPAADGRWVWCMEWPTAFQNRVGVKALLSAGYRWVTFNPASKTVFAGNQNDEMIAKRRAFQKFLVEELGFAPKCGLIGMSWGGYYSVRYASTHPDCVCAAYLDAPLLDFTTLRMYADDSSSTRERLKRYYPFISDAYRGADDPYQSVNRAEPIAKAGIPLLILYGGVDVVVPPESNCMRFADAFEKAGGDLLIERRGRYGHHPHGVEPNEVQRIVNFFDRAYAKKSASGAAKPVAAGGYVETVVQEKPFPLTVREYMYPDARFPITDYGAHPDGTKCTEAFRKAMEACNAAGGGHVVVPKGRWTTGAVHFRSNCDLHLEEGAEVVFTQDPADYLPAVFTSWEGMECWNYSPLVYAFECENVAITGKGTLRGYEGRWSDSPWKAWVPQDNGVRDSRRQLYDWGATDFPVAERQIWNRPNANTRPHFVQFNRCRNVRMEGFRLRESPFWTLHVYMSRNVIVRGIDVYAHGNNNDGIDIEMSRDVLVEKSRFDQGDDSFVIKSGRNRDAWRLATPTENVVVRDCHLEDAHTLLGVGSEISGGVRNIYVHDCSVRHAYRLCYVKTNQRRGGVVENIWFERVKAKSTCEVVSVETDVLYEWAKFPDYEIKVTEIKNLFVKDVECGTANVAVNLRGDKRLPPKGIHLDNVVVGEVTNGFCRAENVKDVTFNGVKLR